MERQLTHLRAKHVAPYAKQIASVEIGPVGKSLVPDVLFADINLQASRAISEVGEDGLAHRALGEKAPR